MYSMLDDVLEKAKMVADIATKKTGEAVEISKFKVEALRLNNQVKHLHEQLGATMYSMTKNDYDNPDLIESLIDEIDETLMILEAINEKISDLKNVARCGVCGAKNIDENFYCCRCGSKIKTNFDNEFYDTENGDKMTINTDANACCADGCDCGDDCGDNCDCDDDCACNTDANACCADGCDCGDNCDCGDDCACNSNVDEEYECSCGCGDQCGNDCICDEDCVCECDKEAYKNK